ncbi:MAG TPA: apolipoprotein N-acyltransferase [Acidimicrobiales bacterium]|nr:apolipoprotein N-acyltransferase [Acidimicrobiales bacterium]
MVGPALVAGVGLALSLPPWGFWVLAFPAAGLLWWRLDGLRLRARLLAGWVAGLGLFAPGLYWATSFNVYGGVVLMVVEALALALACACATRRTRGRTVALAGAMVLAEALRSIWPFGGLPLGGVALGQAAGPLAPAARLGGPLLLVAMVWLAGGGLARVVSALISWARRGRGHLPVTALVAGGLSLAVVAGLSVWGAVAPDGGPAIHTLRAAAVQGGGARGLRQSEVPGSVVYNAQVAATGAIASDDGGRPPQLVLWPEDVVKLDGLIGHSSVQSQLGSLAVSLHATLVVGVTETVPGQRFRNEIVAFSPQGKLVARFEKVHRVPFGEYVPYRGFFSHLADLSAVPLDAVPGHSNGVLRTPAGPLGTMVSYEVFFAERGWVATRAGAQLLVVPTNTSSYKTSQVPTQEIAASRLQAIAEGRDLVQAAPTGFSSVIDNHGRVRARSVLAKRAVVVDDVALRTGKTLYERGGDLPVLVLAGLLLVLGWLLGRPETTQEEVPDRRPSQPRFARGATARRMAGAGPHG